MATSGGGTVVLRPSILCQSRSTTPPQQLKLFK